MDELLETILKREKKLRLTFIVIYSLNLVLYLSVIYLGYNWVLAPEFNLNPIGLRGLFANYFAIPFFAFNPKYIEDDERLTIKVVKCLRTLGYLIWSFLFIWVWHWL